MPTDFFTLYGVRCEQAARETGGAVWYWLAVASYQESAANLFAWRGGSI